MKIPDLFDWSLSLPKYLFGGPNGKRNKLLVWVLTAIVAFIGGFFIVFKLYVDIGFIK